MKWLQRSALVLAAVMVFAPLAARADNPAPPLEKVTIAQFGKARFLLYLPLYTAMEEGLFKKHGLDVDLKFAGNDDQIFAAVVSGQAQFGVGDPVFTAISHDKGGPGKVVALMLTKLDLAGITNEDKIREITAPAQLDGLRISSFPEPSTTYTFLSALKKKDCPNLTIVQAPIGGQIAVLEAGKVDIALDLEPAISIAEDKGYRVVVDITPWTPPQAVTGITTTEDEIANHPQTVQKVVDALQEAVTLLYADPEAAYRVGRKLYPDLPEKTVRHAVARMMKAEMYPRSIVVTDDLWQRTLKTRLDSGELKKPQATDVAVDNRFALKAHIDAAGGK